jgi:hypothetical protein
VLVSSAGMIIAGVSVPEKYIGAEIYWYDDGMLMIENACYSNPVDALKIKEI